MLKIGPCEYLHSDRLDWSSDPFLMRIDQHLNWNHLGDRSHCGAARPGEQLAATQADASRAVDHLALELDPRHIRHIDADGAHRPHPSHDTGAAVTQES